MILLLPWAPRIEEDNSIPDCSVERKVEEEEVPVVCIGGAGIPSAHRRNY